LLAYAALSRGRQGYRFFVPREEITVGRREASPVDQRECRKRAQSRHHGINRKESFSARTGVVELDRGEERK